MKIAYIAAGAAGMYCGSCLHDNTLASALLDLGEEVTLVPTYTPIRTDERDVSQRRVFFGGINVYLQQHVPLLRHTPKWLDRWLDHPALLRAITGRAAAVDPQRLGDLTVSMLRGEAGHQRKELEHLVNWLLDEVQPDVIHLSNSMLLGMARWFRQRCGPPVVCAVSGEDSFLERLPNSHYREARRLLNERASEVDAFTALNTFYADHMAGYLNVDRNRFHVIPHGLNLAGHGSRQTTEQAALRRVGFLARVCHDKGLHLLVEACERLAQDENLPSFTLRAAGYLGPAERSYLRDIELRVANGPLRSRFEYVGEVDREGKIKFLQSLDVFALPTTIAEPKGLPALEALANAVPVVAPEHGCFPELLSDTGGGLLCAPGSSADLAEKISVLLSDDRAAAERGRAGQHAIRDRYHAAAMAQQTRQLYRSLIES